jgi:hypothetical protein
MKVMLPVAALVVMVGDVTSSGVLQQSSATDSPFVGTWVADLQKSTLHPSFKPQSIVLQISVAGETVTIASRIVNVTGQEIKAAETFRTDGTESQGTLTPGVSLVARWLDPRVLATLARKGGDVIALVTYQVSSDGKTLTSRSSGMLELVIVYQRN